MKEKSAWPLFWPESRPRCLGRQTQSRFRKSFSVARDECVQEVVRLGGDNIIISTNIRLRPDGLPYAVDWGKTIADPGVAVYFIRRRRELCFACDCWRLVQDNMHAINLTIQALRGIARWGTGDMMESAFRGFAALPGIGESTGLKWWEVLGLPINATSDQIQAAYRGLVKHFHPDNPETGDADLFHELQEAMRQAKDQPA